MNPVVKKIMEDAKNVSPESSEEEKFQLMKRILLARKEALADSMRVYEQLAKIAVSLYGSPDHETRHELNAKMYDDNVSIVYWLGFGYGQNLDGDYMYEVYATEGSAATSVRNTFESGINQYEPQNRGYHSCVRTYSETKNIAYLEVPNSRNISDILLSSKNYQDFMQNLVERDLCFPFAQHSSEKHCQKSKNRTEMPKRAEREQLR